MSFVNKVVIVTGASSGIGAATAIEFAKEGADVVIVGRNDTKIQNVSAQCEAHGKKPLAIKADVSNEMEAKAAIEKTIDTFGKLDILINNAGIVRYGCILDGRLLETYDEIMSINLRAVLYITSIAAPHLIKTKGNIVNISSIASYRNFVPQLTAYCISKAALTHFTRSAASELSQYGVRVNSVSPGPVKTDIIQNTNMEQLVIEPESVKTALNRISEAVEVADLVLFLASDKAKCVTGSDYVCDNGTLIQA